MNALNILKNLSKRQLISFGIFLVLLIVLPLVVLLAQKQQSLQQRAAENSDALTYLTISTENIGSQSIGSQFESTVHLINNDPSKQITALDITIKDNEDNMNLLGVTSIPGSGFTEAANSQSSGTIHYVAVNLGNLNVISNQNNDIPLLKLTFTAKNAASGTIGVSSASITTLGNNQTINIPDSANKSSPYSPTSSPQTSAGNSDSTIAAIDIILANLDVAMNTESEVYSGLGILNYGNVAQIMITGGKLTGLDDQISLYTAIKKDLSSGKSMEQVLNTYRSYSDSNGQINTAGRQFFQETYGDLVHPGAILAQFDQKCEDYITQQIQINPANQNNPEVWKCSTQSMYKKNEILDFRVKAEKIVKNSNNPLTLALEQYDKVDRGGENLDNQIAEIYFQMAKLLQAKANDDLAIEFYTLVTDKFTASPRVSEAKIEVARLNALGHKAWMLGSTVLIGLVGLDTLIPINPCKEPVKIVCKFVAKKSGAILKIVFKSSEVLAENGEKQLAIDLIKVGVADSEAANVAAVAKKIAKGITPSEDELSAARKAIQEAGEATAKVGTGITKDVPKDAVKLLDQRDLENEVRRIAGIRNEGNYKNQFLGDLEKNGGKTIAAAQKALSARARKYVAEYAAETGRGFLSAESAKLFGEAADQMAKDMAKEYVNESGFLFWKSIDTAKLMKIDELMHKTVASVSYLEHIASGQKFSDHSFRHLYEDLSKVTNAISSSSKFTKSDKIYLTFASLLHDVGYTTRDVVQYPLNFWRSGEHPTDSLNFVTDNLQKDLKEIIGKKSAEIARSNGIESNLKETIGDEGTKIIMDSIEKHGDNILKYTPDNLSGSSRVAAIFKLADDLASDKVPDLYKDPEIAGIVTEFWKESGKRIDLAEETAEYGKKLMKFNSIADSSSTEAQEIYRQLQAMDSGPSLGKFRDIYRQKMLAVLEKKKNDIPPVRFEQLTQAIKATTELDFRFVIRPAIIENTFFSIVERSAGQMGADVTIKISKSSYENIARAVGKKEANKQITKMLGDIIAHGSDELGDAAKKAEDLFINRGGQFGVGNNVKIDFPFSEAELSRLPDIVK